jgi:nucleoside-diphosphate-sugar epimerase
MLPQLIEAVREGRFMWIGGGRHLTSTCHVANVVDGVLCAMDAGRGGEAYIITDGEPMVLRDFMTRMLATQGVDPGNKSVPFAVARATAWVAETLWIVCRCAESRRSREWWSAYSVRRSRSSMRKRAASWGTSGQ